MTWEWGATWRFLSEDPIGLQGGINPLVFAGGDPVAGKDPSGLCKLWRNTWELTFVNGTLVQVRLVASVCVQEDDDQGGGGGGKGNKGSEPQLQACPAGFQSPRPAARITSPFNPARPHPVLPNVVRPHRGIDFSGAVGDPVLAAAAGNISTRVSDSFGNLSAISHANGFNTLYAHLSRFAVTTGNVAAGDTIGFVGQTGLANGPHLHFELRQNGQAIDPAGCLP